MHSNYWRILILLTICARTPACFWDDWEGGDESPCGNGEHDRGEECDDGVHNSDRIPNACRTDCTKPRCGDGVIDYYEQCDREQPAPPRCEDLGFTAGVVTCNRDCRLDTRGCTTCSNGRAEGDDPHRRGYEACDLADLRRATCESLGLGPGRLACSTSCTYDTSACATASLCGDGVPSAPEECDDGDGLDHDGCSANCRWEAPRLSELVSPVLPDFVQGGAMYFDSARSRLVLFAGGALLEYDGEAWTRVSLPASPLYSSSSAMAYDSSRATLVVFGSSEETGTAVPATWEFDGRAWARRRPLHQPSLRGCVGMTYDEARGAVVLFGGKGVPPGSGSSTYETALDDTWVFDGLDWSLLETGHSPPPHTCPMLTYDSARQRVVMVGGMPDLLYYSVVETWELLESDWTEITPASTPTGWSRYRASMTYDARRGRTVLFLAGWATLLSLEQVWEYDGIRWEETTPPERLATANWVGSAVFDPLSQGVLFLASSGTGILRYRWE